MEFAVKIGPIDYVSAIAHCHLLAVQRMNRLKSMSSMTFYIAYWYGEETTAHQHSSSPILNAL